jgi:CxxC motif-containing protein (DUF1111 family)
VVFNRIGCVQCHVNTFQTPNKKKIPVALRKVDFHPYSDFLLLDMGSLGDGIVQTMAGQRDMRTQPLWGLRFETTLLHDERTNNIATGIQAHAGQAAKARNKFVALR